MCSADPDDAQHSSHAQVSSSAAHAIAGRGLIIRGRFRFVLTSLGAQEKEIWAIERLRTRKNPASSTYVAGGAASEELFLVEAFSAGGDGGRDFRGGIFGSSHRTRHPAAPRLLASHDGHHERRRDGDRAAAHVSDETKLSTQVCPPRQPSLVCDVDYC